MAGLARRPARLAAALVLVVAGGCASGDGDGFALDGSPRHPDDQGIVTSIAVDEITLDGERTYGVHPRFVSFSTYTAELEPMLGREGQYVHLGLDGDLAVWMAGVGAVFGGDPPIVLYTGDLVELDGDRAIFADGTVWRLAAGVTPEVAAGPAIVEVDAEAHRAIAVTSAS